MADITGVVAQLQILCPMGCQLAIAIPCTAKAKRPKAGKSVVHLSLQPDFTPLRDHLAARHDVDLDAD